MINEVLDVMVELAGTGMTMVCVTHEMGFARKVADKMVFMEDGRIVETAPPETVLRESFEQAVPDVSRPDSGSLRRHGVWPRVTHLPEGGPIVPESLRSERSRARFRDLFRSKPIAILLYLIRDLPDREDVRHRRRSHGIQLAVVPGAGLLLRA